MQRFSSAFLCVLVFPSLLIPKVHSQTMPPAQSSNAGFAVRSFYPPASSTDSLPDAPGPALGGGAFQAPWQGTVHYGRFSRAAVGADISPLGFGIKGAIILAERVDFRLMGNILSYTGNYNEIEDVQNVGGQIRLASLQTAIDWYPRNSIWRLSVGGLLWNGNQITAHGTEKGGTSFSLTSSGGKSDTYWSSTADPLTFSALLNMHTNEPALTVSGGFGRYIPRSERHWSFPAEFGVVFMGAPAIHVTTTGMVCTNQAQTDCVDASGTGSPFYQDLLSEERRFQIHALNHVTVWPIFSYGVMYSFSAFGR